MAASAPAPRSRRPGRPSLPCGAARGPQPTAARPVPRSACRRCRRHSSTPKRCAPGARLALAGAGPGARGDRRDQCLPGRRRRHRHQPVSDRGVGRPRPSRRSFAGARGERPSRRRPALAEAVRADGARRAASGPAGNSGTILAQLLRGMAERDSAASRRDAGTDGRGLRAGPAARRRLGARGRGAPGRGHHPHRRLGRRATRRRRPRRDRADVARAAYDGRPRRPGRDPRAARRTGPRRGRRRGRARAGRGARGAGGGTCPGEAPVARPVRAPRACPCRRPPDALRAGDADGRARVRGDLPAGGRRRGRRRGCATRLDGLGDSLVVVGGDGLWNVHVHVDDAGCRRGGGRRGRAAVPDPDHALRATTCTPAAPTAPGAGPAGRRRRRARARGWPGCAPRRARPPCSRGPGSPPPAASWSRPSGGPTPARWCCCPNDADLRHTAAAAAEQARTEGIRVAADPDPLGGPGHRRPRRARAGPALRRGRGRHDLGGGRHPLRRTRRRGTAVLDHRPASARPVTSSASSTATSP